MSDYEKISPFKWQLLESFPFIANDFDEYTEYALYCKLVEYMNKVIDGTNTLGEDVEEYIAKFNQLQNYVETYFDNLDVQDEINNKLNEMAEDGTLENLLNNIFESLESDIDSLESNINVLSSRMDEFTQLADGSTTGDAELADIRVAYTGVTYDTAGDSVRAQANEQVHQKNYIAIDESLSNGDNDFEVNIDIIPERPLYAKVVNNNTSSDGYFEISTRWTADNNLFSQNIPKLVAHGNSQTYQLTVPKHCTIVRVKNTNNIANCKVTIYQDLNEFISNETNNSKELYNDIKGNDFVTINDVYIKNDGTQGASNQYKINITSCNEGDKFLINSKAIGWASMWGYENDGTSHALTSNRDYINEIITIPENSDITFIGFTSKNSTTDSIERYTLEKEIEDNKNLKNYNCYDTNNLITQGSVTNGTATKTSNSITLAITDNTTNCRVNYTSNISITEANSMVGTRFKVQADGYMKLSICVYTANNNLVYYLFDIEANKTYELYTFSKNLATGSIKFEIKSVAGEKTAATTFTITDLRFVVNSYDVYKDINDFKTMKKFDTNTIVVDAAGNGNYYNLPEAVDFFKNNRNVATTPCTIFVKNGFYKVYPTNNSPYSPIFKGANMISIIGESRDGVIISCENTKDTQSKVMDIGGPCTIENLTINCLRNENYTLEYDLTHAPYCIHNDRNYTTDTEYITKVKNCKLYSECHSPVGAGLRNKQKQIYENVETISNGIKSLGSLYIHAPGTSTDANCSVEINNCTAISLDSTKALNLPDVSGSLAYTNIPTTIQRSIFVSNGSSVIDNNFKTTHDLTDMSALNNIEDLNA